MTLPEIRKKIDAIDEGLLALLNERADLVHEVGVTKRAQKAEIYAPEREEQVLRSLVERNRESGRRLPESAIRAIYREIMSASLALEKDLTIAYFGPEATNTHQAARSKFGSSVQYVPQVSIGDVFDAVARGSADYGVVPIENSTEGAVNHTLDMFMESDLRICAQILLKIENHLLAKIPQAEIRRLYSHPQVFGQCRQWLRNHLPHADLIEVSSTARAAEVASTEAGCRGDRRPDGGRSARPERRCPFHPGYPEQHHALSRDRPVGLSPNRTGPHLAHVLRARRTRRAL